MTTEADTGTTFTSAHDYRHAAMARLREARHALRDASEVLSGREGLTATEVRENLATAAETARKAFDSVREAVATLDAALAFTGDEAYAARLRDKRGWAHSRDEAAEGTTTEA